MDDLLNDFLAETAEQIDAAGLQLIQLERDPTNTGIIRSVFRLVHTIKGTCGFLGLARLERLTHAAEALIGKLRDGAPATAETVTLILSTVDRIKFILAALESSASEPEGEDGDLIEALQGQIRDVEPQAETATISEPPAAGPKPAPSEADPKPAAATAPDAAAGASSFDQRRPETIRVAVGALERIMILVSELVLTRNQLLEITRRQDDEVIKAPLQRLSALTTDLQDAVMRARMQPVGRLFASLPRLIRELSNDLGKKLRLVTDGADTEIDRQLIERIRDPLTHMIRNCADHGIELPAERKALGKPEAGLVQVAASHEAGYITIEVVDDGRGLDLARIREKALSKGIVTQGELDKLSDDEVSRFIFAPNFSTATTVTNISGRGVGMDVVRDNIESIGGTISLTTTPGKGSRFALRIPLTLAIAPALIVEVGGHRFALPQNSVVEAVGVDDKGGAHKLERVQGSLVLRLRDQVLPVADLAELLGLDRGGATATPALAMIMRVGTLAFGILVDGVADVQEIVVKPLGPSLSDIAQFSGHTILGDGSVVLILDPAGIAHNLGLEEMSEHAILRAPETFVAAIDTTRLVLFRSGPGILKAIPLSLIARIETVDVAAIARSGSELVMQHQGRLMPLVPVSPESAMGDQEQPILVLSIGGESMGLLIDEIVDIIEAKLDIEIAGAADRIVGTAQIRDEVVEILDVAYFMRLGRPKAFARAVVKRFTVLLVDDKQFFRDMLSPILKAAGYNIVTAASGEDALAMLERGAQFQAIVTDTDMPGMSGYEFARALLADSRWSQIPVVALAAHAAPAVVQAAAVCGMRAAVGKFDRAGLLTVMAQILDAQELNEHALERSVIQGKAA